MAEKSPLQVKLEGELTVTGWAPLDNHYKRDAVFLVDPALPLVMVAMAVSEDSVADIQAWISAGQLVRPTLEQVAQWEEGGQRFQFLIVQPYVLITPQVMES